MKRASDFKLPPELLKYIPAFGIDPRQEQFIAATESDEELTANVQSGYLASAPDIGFVQWLSLAAIQVGMDRREAIRAAVINGVQCVEFVTVRPTKKDNVAQVSFTTHDDLGTYGYKFYVDEKVRSYPTPLIVERLSRMAEGSERRPQ